MCPPTPAWVPTGTAHVCILIHRPLASPSPAFTVGILGVGNINPLTEEKLQKAAQLALGMWM